jgi:hypothetical protein
MFAGTGITEAEIPASVKYFFTSGVFANCTELVEVRIVNAQPTDANMDYYNTSMFEGCDLDEVTVIWGWVEEEA